LSRRCHAHRHDRARVGDRSRRCFTLCRGYGGDCGTIATATLSAAPRASLQQAAAAWVEAFERRDADAVTRWFADDIIAWYPRPEQSIGRAVNRDVWRGVFDGPNNRHPITTDTVVVSDSGDLGYTMGRYRSHYERPSATVDTGGRYVAVWRHAGGEWRIAVLSAHHHDTIPEVP
jgi:ketosteroid isomerase-like protein